MAITSVDNVVNAFGGGKQWKTAYNKITGASAYTIGRWYDLSILNGSPVANTYSGTALNSQALTDTSAGALWHGGNVSTDTKNLVNAGFLSAVSTFVPGVILLCDLLLYYPGINMNSSSLQTLTTGTTLPRYTTGAGVFPFLVITAAPGSTAQNIASGALSYTNQAGTSGQTNPVTVANTASAIVGHLTHAGVATNNYGPFLPLASGDYGVRSVQSIQFSAAAGTGGTGCLVLAKPLCWIPLTVASVGSERNFLFQVPSLPRIVDGAYIAPLFFAGAAVAANSNIYGYMDFIWG